MVEKTRVECFYRKIQTLDLGLFKGAGTFVLMKIVHTASSLSFPFDLRSLSQKQWHAHTKSKNPNGRSEREKGLNPALNHSNSSYSFCVFDPLRFGFINLSWVFDPLTVLYPLVIPYIHTYKGHFSNVSEKTKNPNGWSDEEKQGEGIDCKR